MAKNSFSLPQFPLPPRNRYSSRKEWERACWKRITESGALSDLIVTSNEKLNIVTRAAVIELMNLKKGVRQIARDLQVSLQTVTVIKKALKEKGYKSYRERGKTERKKKVYGVDNSKKKKEPYRYYRRTKYGKVYMPYY